MARPLRIQYEGAFYHALSRGNAGTFILADDRQKHYFLSCLSEGLQRYEVVCFAYCIMGNHYHLLIQTKQANLSLFMHYLGSAYASYLSKNGWDGHVFGGRYKSILVEENRYLIALSRYIHQNPMRAGIVRNPLDYVWSSYPYFVSTRKAPPWLDTDMLLAPYGENRQTARKRFREFIEESEEPMPTNAFAQAILGSEKFVQKAIAYLENDIDWENTIGKEALRKPVSFSELYRQVCDYYGFDDLRTDIGTSSSHLRHARFTLVYLAKELTAATNRQIIELSGKCKSVSAVTYRYKAVLKELEGKDRSTASWLDEIDELKQRLGVRSDPP